MIVAIVIFVLGSIGLLALEDWLIDHPKSTSFGNWIVEHLYLPLLRAALVLAFVALAYPAIYGLSDAPALSGLLTGGHYRFDSWINAVLVASLLLPLVPGLGRIPGLLLALQGIIATAMLFGWVADAYGLQDEWLIPSWPLMFKILVITGGAALLSWMAGRSLQLAQGKLVAEAVRLTAQMPALIIYGKALGAQIPGAS